MFTEKKIIRQIITQHTQARNLDTTSQPSRKSRQVELAGNSDSPANLRIKSRSGKIRRSSRCKSNFHGDASPENLAVLVPAIYHQLPRLPFSVAINIPLCCLSQNYRNSREDGHGGGKGDRERRNNGAEFTTICHHASRVKLPSTLSAIPASP